MDADDRLHGEVARHSYPLIFAPISGAHLYGFPSPDSDLDLRGCHVLPVHEVVGLDTGRETVESSTTEGGFEVDLVTHDARKFFGLLLRKNGYVLEQLYSPLVVHTTPEHEELKAIAKGCITRHHSHHYFGFAETQWRLFEKESPRRVKPLLYVYRVLLTGIHLMRTGEVEANLVRLNAAARLSQPPLGGVSGRHMASCGLAGVCSPTGTALCEHRANAGHGRLPDPLAALGGVVAAAGFELLKETHHSFHAQPLA